MTSAVDVVKVTPTDFKVKIYLFLLHNLGRYSENELTEVVLLLTFQF